MELLTCMFSSSLKKNSCARTIESWTLPHQPGQHISIRTFRKLKAQAMSNPTWRETETSLIMEFSTLVEDQLEEVANLPATHMPRQSMQGPKLRPTIY
uniref:AC4 protein n=1 Tax=Tomato leaf curl virus TaxID=28350 RepID=A0A5J6AC11_9GEMI|nr:AC4 protein [Tomato leaf curl virus]